MRKKLALLGAAGALALAPLTAAPAQATTVGPCPSGYFCLFDDVNGTGLTARFQNASPDLRLQGMDNRAGAYWNRTTGTWSLYDGYNYTGACLSITALNSGGLPPEWDDRVSSLRPGECVR